MHFTERDVGDFRIYAGAIEEPLGGYVAGVVVHRRRGLGRPPELVFRDDRLFGAHRFDKANDALMRALDAGHRAIRAASLSVA
jgi:hypothetical protein